MNKEVEQKIYTEAIEGIKKIFKNNDSIANNYHECWLYLDKLIEMVDHEASECLLRKLSAKRDHYRKLYLINKGLI